MNASDASHAKPKKDKEDGSENERRVTMRVTTSYQTKILYVHMHTTNLFYMMNDFVGIRTGGSIN